MASFQSSPSSSSSSSLPTGTWTYDAFLSFRGDDTRYNFVDHLYAALVQRGICAFKDDDTLRRGEPISPELLKAIEESRFAVVVFSKNYADSSWCLHELAKIMECQDRMGQKVLPVFYHVDPSDVRGLKRDFDTAFRQHEEKFWGEMDKVKKWREALTAAANLSGLPILETVKEGESSIINKIVQEILGDIQPPSMENNLIGIESHMNALNSLLRIEATEEVCMVGIWGMGGIGKTTIAQALFRRIAYKFGGSSFVKDVRENSSNKRDICTLQEKILKEILLTHHEFMIKDPEDGARKIQKRFCNRRVLLVLDDVDNAKQLEFLAATHEWFGPGSRIIITTRDKHLLSHANDRYKPACLLIDQAVELFSRHAFLKNRPPDGYEKLSNRAIGYTGCLPLALKVLGSYFHGRQAGVWESALNKLAKTPNMEIFKTLKLSFDGLDFSEKKIFLDIACFFKGKDKEHVTRVLDSFGFDPVIGISVLIEKSLITVSDKRLDMHDLTQEMGWQIVRESSPNSRLWQLDEIHDFIKKNRKLKAIEAIVVPRKKYGDYQYDEKLSFSADVFENMKNLRLLDVFRKFTSCEPTFLPDELRWLHWNQYPFSSLPIAHMRKLVGLEMIYGEIEHLWKGRKIILPNLKFIHLIGLNCLTKFPDVSGAPNVERLILANCFSLVEVHESLGSLRRLDYLDMSGCHELKCLPSRIKMESLETLILSRCYGLERFPEVSPCMVKLSNIYLDSCFRIEELPSSIRYLSSLSFLNLTECRSLKNIPNSICELQHLKRLLLHNCEKLQKLPDELGSMEKLEDLRLGFDYYIGPLERPLESFHFRTWTSLSSLRKLDLSWRQIEDKDFPKNLHAFSSLEELHLSGNSKLIHLPARISHLSRLKHLQLNECYRLQNLHALPSGIQVLKASNCCSLEKIEDLSEKYEWLYKIWFAGCRKLLEDQENERYLDKMLQQSFLKKCAAADHYLSIRIPGSKIPSWFKEQQHGGKIALKLPPKWHTQIMGFAICCVFDRNRHMEHDSPLFAFKIVNDGMIVPEFSERDFYGMFAPEFSERDFYGMPVPKFSERRFFKLDQIEREFLNILGGPTDLSSCEVDCINAAAATENGDVWIVYIPFRRQMYQYFRRQDWSHTEGDLVMTVAVSGAVRHGAHIVHKEDVESIQQIEACMSDYGSLELERGWRNTSVWKEKFTSF